MTARATVLAGIQVPTDMVGYHAAYSRRNRVCRAPTKASSTASRILAGGRVDRL